MFRGHGKGTNQHSGRIEVGEILETFERELPDGRTQAIAIGILDNEYPDLDVCSIEAEVDISTAGVVIDVPVVSALALGNSSVDSPAFPGAQRLASMQFFGDDNKQEPETDSNRRRRMTYAEIKAGVEELGLAPHRLFTADQVKDDNRLMKDIGGEYVEQISSLTKERDELIIEKGNLSKQAEDGAEARTQLALANGKTQLEGYIPEGTTDKQKKFLMDEFAPGSVDDLSEDAIKSYVTDGTKRFAELARLFGDESSPTGGSNPPDDAGSDNEPKDKLLEAIIG